jgi:uncharacterized membrane protein YgdD (TMEM256/DUF423 family)
MLAMISGFMAVIAGAFGAHALKPHLNDYQQSIFETASRYHFYHTLAMLAVSFYARNKLMQYTAWCFLTGMLLFSGSLYLLAVSDLLHITYQHIIGAVTPVGGMFFLTGWILGLFAILKNDASDRG